MPYYKLDLKNRLKAKGRGEGGNLEPLAFSQLNSNYLKWRLYFPSFVQILVTTQVVRFRPACPDYIGTGRVHSSGVQLGAMNDCPYQDSLTGS